MLACGQAGRQGWRCPARTHLSVILDLERLRGGLIDLIDRMRHIETLYWLSCGDGRCVHSRTAAPVQLSRLSKFRKHCRAISVSGYRVTSVTRDARDKR